MSTTPLLEILQKYPYTLALSSGFFGFYAHLGVLKALVDLKLPPARLTGSSAGALVAGLWGMGVPIDEMEEALFQLRRQDFWDPAFGMGLLRGHKFDRILKDLLPRTDLGEAQHAVAISVCRLPLFKSLSYSTGPASELIRASCALPLLFHPVWIGGHCYVDGGLTDHTSLKGTETNDLILYHHLPPHGSLPHNKLMSFAIPHRSRMHVIEHHNLPMVHPFELEKGRLAFDQTYRDTIQLLS